MRCFIKSCKNKKHQKPLGISFHRFPKDSLMRQKWLESIGCPDAKVLPHSHVCSEHFLFGDLFRLNNKILVGKNAIPQLKLDAIQTNLQEKDTVKFNIEMQHSHECYEKGPSTDEKLCFHHGAAITVTQQLPGPGQKSNIGKTQTNIELPKCQEEILYTMNIDEIQEDSAIRQPYVQTSYSVNNKGYNPQYNIKETQTNIEYPNYMEETYTTDIDKIQEESAIREVYGQTLYSVMQLLPEPDPQSNIKETQTNIEHPNYTEEICTTDIDESEEDCTATSNLQNSTIIYKDYHLEIRKLEGKNRRLKKRFAQKQKTIRELLQKTLCIKKDNLKLHKMIKKLRKNKRYK